MSSMITITDSNNIFTGIISNVSLAAVRVLMSAFNVEVAAGWDQTFEGVLPTPQGSKVVMVQGGR